jgi:hypothetical protein
MPHRPPKAVVVCRVCGEEVKPGGSKRDRLCVRHYHAAHRHPDRPLVAERKRVPGRVGVRTNSVLHADLLALVDALRGGRTRSAWIAEAIQEKARRETAPADAASTN